METHAYANMHMHEEDEDKLRHRAGVLWGERIGAKDHNYLVQAKFNIQNHHMLARFNMTCCLLQLT